MSENTFEEIIPIDDQETEDDITGAISFKSAVSQAADWTLETIYGQLAKGNIDLSPGFQRRAAWDDIRKSRLIESIIVGMPVPNIVLAENKDRRGASLVIDGKQRLITIEDFYSGKFKLKGLDIRTDLNDLAYDDLPLDDRNFLDNSTLRATLIKNWKDENFLYAIFFRLNSGSLPLSPQELRKALIGGRLLERIERYIVASNPFHTIFGDEPDKRMRDSELVLRFVAFDTRFNEYDGNLKRFLDATAEYYEVPQSAQELEDRLVRLDTALNATYRIFGKNAFKKWTPEGPERRMNRAVFDCLARYFAEQDIADQSAAKIAEIVQAYQQLCSQPAYKDAVEKTTKSLPATRYRLQSWGEALAGLLGRNFDGVTFKII